MYRSLTGAVTHIAPHQKIKESVNNQYQNKYKYHELIHQPSSTTQINWYTSIHHISLNKISMQSDSYASISH